MQVYPFKKEQVLRVCVIEMKCDRVFIYVRLPLYILMVRERMSSMLEAMI